MPTADPSAESIEAVIPAGGFVSDWLKHTGEFEYPPIYSVFSLLVMASCAIDKRILINPGAKPETWTNIYVLLYGPSGARKSEALLDALCLLGDAIPDAPILPMNFTMEALRGRLHADSEANGRAAGLILSEELSTLLGGRDYLLNNSLFLSKVWEGRPYETFLTIAHQEQIVRNSYIVLGGCSTPEAFGDLDPRGLSTGFLRRLLPVVAHGPARESPLPNINSTFYNTKIVPTFKERMARIPKDSLMRLSQEAQWVNRDWYEGELRELRHSQLGPRESHFINSLQVHAFKIAAVLQVLEGGAADEMTAESLQTAIRILRVLRPGVFEAYAALVPTPFARARSTAVRIVAAAPHPLSDMQLDQALWKELGIQPEQAAQARLSLLSDNTLHRTKGGKIGVTR